MDNGMERKSLNFNLEDAEHKKVFDFLEKTRYYQTRFIIKLVLDFLNENNITEKTPYEEIKTIIGLYLKNQLKYKNNNVPQQIDLNKFMLDMYALQCANINNPLLNPNMVISQNTKNTSVDISSSENNNIISPSTKKNSNANDKPVNMSDFDMNIDIDEDDDDMSNMLAGFNNMIT